MSDFSELDRLLALARSLDLLTQADIDAIKEDIANGGTTEEAAVAAWKTRTQDAVWPFYKAITWETPTQTLRFAVGDHVQACMGDTWAAAIVVAHWWRSPHWPAQCFAPYQMRLVVAESDEDGDGDEPRLVDEEHLIFAPADSAYYVVSANVPAPTRQEIDEEMVVGFSGTVRDAEENMREWERESGHGAIHVCCMWKDDTASLRRVLRRPMPECDPNNNGNRFRETPLHMCANYGSLHCAILLLAAGADPRVPNCYGKSAVTTAEQKGEVGGGPMSTPEATEALITLLKRRAAELDAEEAE